MSFLDQLKNAASVSQMVSSPSAGIVTVTEGGKVALADVTDTGSKTLGALSATGTVSYAGFLHYPTERDSAWNTQDARDKTIIEMSNNPIIGGVLRQIQMFIRKVEWTLVPADDSTEALEVKKFYQEQLDGMKQLWPGETMPQMLTFLNWGWSALEIIYKQLPDGRIGWDEWRLIPQETRWRWVINDRGEAEALIQLDPQTWREITIPLTKCIHVRDTARNNSPEGFTLLRIAYDAYFYRSGFQQLEGTLFERYGGIQVARIPGEDISGKTEAYTQLQHIVTTVGINSQTGLILASDRDPATNEYYQDFHIEAPASGATVPSADPIINRYANEIVGVFGAAITRTGQDGSGSYALADIQDAVFQRNMEAYLDLIADNIQNQAFPRLAAMPYNDIDPKLIPKLKHGKLDKVGLKELGTFLVSLAQAGVIEDSPELRQYVHGQASIPTPTVEEMQEEFDERAKQAEEQRRQFLTNSQARIEDDKKIDPRKSLEGTAEKKVDEGKDPQKLNQDKVPPTVKKPSA